MEGDEKQRILAKVLSEDTLGPFHPVKRAQQLKTETELLELKNVRYLIQKEEQWKVMQERLKELSHDVVSLEHRVDGYVNKCSERLQEMTKIEKENRDLHTVQANVRKAHQELQDVLDKITIPRNVDRCIEDLGKDLNGTLSQSSGVRMTVEAVTHLEKIMYVERPNLEKYNLRAVSDQLKVMASKHKKIVNAFSVHFNTHIRAIGAAMLAQKERFSRKGKMTWKNHEAEVFSVYAPMSPVMRAVPAAMGYTESTRLARVYTTAMKPVYHAEIKAYFYELQQTVSTSTGRLLGDYKYNKANLEWVLEAAHHGTSLGGGTAMSDCMSDRAPSPVSAQIYQPSPSEDSQQGGVQKDGREVRLDRAYAAMIDCLFDAVYTEYSFLEKFIGNDKQVNGMLEELFEQGEHHEDGNLLSKYLREMNLWVVEHCDKLYLLPVLSAMHTYIKSVEKKQVFLEKLLRYGLNLLELMHSDYVQEQVESIATCRCDVKTTPLLPYFVKYGLLVGRTERLNGTLANVEASYTQTLLTAIAQQIFVSLDIQANMYPKYTSLTLYRHSSYFIHLYEERFGPVSQECLASHVERSRRIKDISVSNYIDGMLIRDALPEISAFVQDVEAILATHEASQVQIHQKYTRPLSAELARRVHRGLSRGVQLASTRLDKHFTRGLPAGSAEGSSPDEEFHRGLRAETQTTLKTRLVQTITKFYDLLQKCYGFSSEEVPLMSKLDINTLVGV